jgi:NTP pyrophosphatase (non-canonical NTP hydrolase)
VNIQQQITDWHLATFGPHCTNERIERKLVEEVIECRLALSDGADWPQEAADVVIVLYSLCGRNGVDLDAEVRRKFEQVKARTDQIERDARKKL